MPVSKKPSIKPGSGQRRAVLLFIQLALLVSTTGWAFAGNSDQPAQTISLVDRWVRPDGGYILELREFGSDGSLSATYYNPKPIHVGRAGWRAAEQGLDLFVELRDVNYPGSIYTLHYDPVTDLMQGIYFQAVQQQSYQVIFTRSR